MHGEERGALSNRRLTDADCAVRARAYRTVGEAGFVEALDACISGIHETDASCSLWAARSAVLLGDRGIGLEALRSFSAVPGPLRLLAFDTVIQASTPAEAREFLRESGTGAGRRWLIRGCGVSGDPRYVPWLLDQMSEPPLSRAAGEAVALITGLDLETAKVDRDRPEGVESIPNDDPEDSDVRMDPDDSLAWPDAAKVGEWWKANSGRFQTGTRHFLGAPVARGHCIEVLRNGYQRQRILAAHHLCLLEPGTPLFNTSAPAWRQQRLLATM